MGLLAGVLGARGGVGFEEMGQMGMGGGDGFRVEVLGWGWVRVIVVVAAVGG